MTAHHYKLIGIAIFFLSLGLLWPITIWCFVLARYLPRR